MTAYQGTPVSDGVATGDLYLPDAPAPRPDECPIQLPMTRWTGHSSGGDVPGTGEVSARGGTVRAGEVRAAFAAVAGDRAGLAERLRADGRDAEADIVRIGALIAADPALVDPALAALGTAPDVAPTAPDASGDTSAVPVPVAVAAVREAAEAQASILEALPDPDLAQRAGDVRQVAEAVIARLTGGCAAEPPAGPFILVRREVDPADLIRLADGGPPGAGARLVGAVSVGGGASSHAAIIARGLGLPMLAGADEAVLGAPAGHPAIVDAGAGELVVDPSPADLARAASADGGGLDRAIDVAPADSNARSRTPRTASGELVTVLCNVASAAETRLGLSGGAAGVGLLRTEIPFTGARGWPSREDHLAQLRPVLGLLAGKQAVVRLLDFSGDKIPPFPGAKGLHALLDAPGALRDQLAAILEAGAGADLAVMIPMVRSLDEVERVRGELAPAAKHAGTGPPPLGMMVEVAATAAAADHFAPHVDFFSIGTNDLTADILRRERAALLPSSASEPAVLAAIAHVVRAARRAGIGVSVCGDSAADPAVLPLLIGAGVRTVSVGAARVPQVARWIAKIDTAEAPAANEATETAEVAPRPMDPHAR
jgi:phosphoenolpyruvate-protein kinase (PTS system EI component)